MAKLYTRSSVLILNAGRKNLIVISAFTIMDAAFFYANNIGEYLFEDGIKTSFRCGEMKLVGFCEIEADKTHDRIVNPSLALDGVEWGKYGLSRLYETIHWTKNATKKPRHELMAQMRQVLSREGNRYLREKFIHQQGE